MPQLSPAEEKRNLHNYIPRLVAYFGRDTWFTIEDLYDCGKTTRRMVGDNVMLPPGHVPGYLEELKSRGLVDTKNTNTIIEFRVTDSYGGLPDKITPDDIYKEKMSILSNKLTSIAPEAYSTLAKAEQKLLTATTDADISEIGNLCVQCLEDFCEVMWDTHIIKGKKPAKKQIKDMLSPVVQLIGSKSTQEMQNALWGLFDANRNHIEKLKHRAGGAKLNIHDAKLAVLLTATICEEVLFYFN